MFWKKDNYFHTLAFRMTLLFGLILSLFSIIIFVFVFFHLKVSLNLQVDNKLSADMDELEEIYEKDGLNALQYEFDSETAAGGSTRIFFKLFSPQKKMIASSDLSKWQSLDDVKNFSNMAVGRIFETVSIWDRSYKTRIIYSKTADGCIFQIGVTLQSSEQLLSKYKQTFWTIFGLMLICGSISGWLMARHAMAGVNRIAKTAFQISQGDLTLRVPLGREGLEISGLAKAFNNMIERIQVLISEVQEVTNNIAHDLRSPITRIRGISETTLSGEQSIEAYQKMTQDIIAESDRFIVMINTMLDIAQTESGISEFPYLPVDMAEIIDKAYQIFLPVAEDKNINFRIDKPENPLTVSGDRSRLQRLVANILDNAIKYTDCGGRVTVSAKLDSAKVIIEISDTGIGISKEDISRIFERFYRADKTRSSIGNGLGLSLAQAILLAHKGSISVNSTLGKSTVFKISLPYAG